MARHRPHLLVTLPVTGDRINLDDATRNHLERVLRYPSGSAVSYTDGAGLLGTGVVTDGLLVRGEERMIPKPRGLTVAVAPPHENARTRFLVEKMGELAVGRLLWLRTEHGRGRPPKREKALAWARSALEQSRGVWRMEIGDLVTIAELGQWGTPVFAEAGGVQAGAIARLPDPVLCIGPEGGFGAGEIPDETVRLDLGDTVLRVETAAIAGVVLLRS
jgi:16S rRNA U1498 N3-methylase RsmE